MGAVFAGIVRAPVTSIVIFWEMTNNYSIILPLMVANITSYVLSTKLSPGLSMTHCYCRMESTCLTKRNTSYGPSRSVKP